MAKKSGGHTVMSRKLADALMEAGVQHFDEGGEASVGGPGARSVDAIGVPRGTFLGELATGGDQLWGFNDYSASAPEIIGQNDFLSHIAQQRENEMGNYIAQQQLSNMLLQQANGGGPNPALQQLQNQTGQNVNQQAALMASQRGASQNPALLARQIATQGAQVQQQAIGQQAVLQAQQQQAAQQQMANVYNNQANSALQGENITQGALASYNTAHTQGVLGAQNINSNVSGQNAQNAGGLLGGVLGGAGSMMGGGWEGGEVKGYADGGTINYSNPSIQEPALMPYTSFKQPEKSGGGGGGMMSMLPMLMALQGGGKIPGQPEVNHNSPKNDKVPALLSPGEIVLPLSVTKAPDMEKKAIEFLRHLKSGKKGYGGVIDAKKMNCGGKV